MIGLGISLTEVASRGAGGLSFPAVGAALDLDFVHQLYWWNGAIRTTGNFTTYTLSGATFGANGLTMTGTMDMTIALAGVGAVFPGVFAASVRNGAAPGATVFWCSIDDGSANNRLHCVQNTDGSIQIAVVNGGAVQANQAAAAALNTAHGVAWSSAVNDFKWGLNGATQVADVVGTLPTVTTLRMGKGIGGSGAASGTLKRVVLFGSVKTQAQLNALSTAMQGFA